MARSRCNSRRGRIAIASGRISRILCKRQMKSGLFVSVVLALFAFGKGIMNASDAKPGATQTATVGGGCFWCLEALYETFDGVKAVTSGYAGGHKENPTYKEVCSEGTGHAEVVQVEFDPAKISYDQILEIFWD